MIPKICKHLHNGQILCVKKLLDPKIIRFSQSAISILQSYEGARFQSSSQQLTHSKDRHDISKKPKIRTYVNYETDYVKLQIHKCYSCYVAAAVLAAAICYEFWSNIKDTAPVKKIIGSSTGIELVETTNKAANNQSDQANAKVKSYYLKRFESYATIEIEGKYYMTPRDFLDSVIFSDQEFKANVRRRKVYPQEHGYMLHIVPRIYDETTVKEALSSNPQLLRSLGAHGIISYSEYLFLLSLLTRPKRGLRHAFDVIDTSQEGTVMRSEFFQFLRLATAKRFEKFSADTVENSSLNTANTLIQESQNTKSIRESTLLVHFFGRTNASGIYHDLTYEEFSAFITGFQREIRHAEFEEYSRGHDFIAEEDFAEIFLKYTNFTFEECVKRMLWLSSFDESERVGIQFRDFELFCRLLNNLEDFTVAAKYISQAGRPLSRKEFKRAAKVCLNGKELSSHLVDTIFILFGAAEGNDELSMDEFKNVMRNRLKRRVGIPINQKWSFQSFKKCFRQALIEERNMPKQPL